MMNCNEAKIIRHEFLVSFAEVRKKTREEFEEGLKKFKETLKKYSVHELLEAYIVLEEDLEKDQQLLKDLFNLAVEMKGRN
jgi:hypothetical protein